MNGLTQKIKAEAMRLGFSHCGIANNDTLEEKRSFYASYVQRNGNAGLKYLETSFEERLHPELLLEGTRSVIALLMNYFPPEIIPDSDNFIISKYAYGPDYHALIRDRVNKLAGFIKSAGDHVRTRDFVDSGQVFEKAWAQKCGVGWQGKNTLVINRSAGSFFFVGIIFTDAKLEPDQPETDHCGSCSKCVNSCPTGALDTPYQLNIPRCISYLTIEKKEEIPGNLKDKLNDRIYGCDLCQDVCPYNSFAVQDPDPVFRAPEILMLMRKKEWITLEKTQFDRIFADSPVKRAGYEKLMSNIRAASGL